MKSRIERIQVGPIGENAYIVQSGQEAFLVDPGDDADKIVKAVESSGLRIGAIVLTHGHLDHCAALPDLMERWAENRPSLCIHELDAHYLGEMGRSSHARIFAAIGGTPFFEGYWRPLPEADILLKDGDVIPGTEFVVMHTPGHSAGSICLHGLESAILISGDTLFRHGIGRSDTPDASPSDLEESLRRIARLPHATVVHPGHGPWTTIDREFPRRAAEFKV